MGILHYGPAPECEPSHKHNLNNSIFCDEKVCLAVYRLDKYSCLG